MVNYSLNNAFSALSDTTRRDMLQRLIKSEMSVSELAMTYDMSLPAVSKHIGVLLDAGVVVKEKRGRQYFVRLTPAGLQKATEYLYYYQIALHNRLDSFRTYMHHTKADNSTQAAKASHDEKEQTLTFSVIVDDSPKSAWQAYTKPDCIKEWWGSSKNSLNDIKNDVRVGGSWQFRSRSANNEEYLFSGRYTRVEYSKCLEYTDGIGDPFAPRPEAKVTVTFEHTNDCQTLVTKKTIARPAVHQLNAAWLNAAGIGQGS
jgi:uncharacterized protein YndB with AHSA1/START domain/DNA-binding transcriptional ArsR family regulator